MFAKYLSANGCLITYDNDDAVFLYQNVCFYQQPMKYWSDPFAQQHDLSISTKVLICKTTEDKPEYYPERKELLQIIKTMQKFSLFLKGDAIVFSYANHVDRIINQHFVQKSRQTIIRDYFPIRDQQRLEFVKSTNKRRNSTALSKFSIFSNIR